MGGAMPALCHLRLLAPSRVYTATGLSLPVSLLTGGSPLSAPLPFPCLPPLLSLSLSSCAFLHSFPCDYLFRLPLLRLPLPASWACPSLRFSFLCLSASLRFKGACLLPGAHSPAGLVFHVELRGACSFKGWRGVCGAAVPALAVSVLSRPGVRALPLCLGVPLPLRLVAPLGALLGPCGSAYRPGSAWCGPAWRAARALLKEEVPFYSFKGVSITMKRGSQLRCFGAWSGVSITTRGWWGLGVRGWWRGSRPGG